jgi:uncharacterized protein (TIGR02996 family)
MTADFQDHPEYRALVAAVRAAASDDLPRLVMADWIEEHGDPAWAEFIRVECELERNPFRAKVLADTYTDDEEGVKPECERAVGLYRRAKVLWEQVSAPAGLVTRPYRRILPNGRFLLEPDFAPNELRSGWRFEFRRGFVSHVKCKLLDWIDAARRSIPPPLLVRRQPVSWVRVTDAHPRHSIDGWEWSCVGEFEGHMLPWEVFDHLPSGARYHSEEEANAALSVALLAWAEARG